MVTPALSFPEVTNSTDSADICRQHKELAQKSHPTSPYQARCLWPSVLNQEAHSFGVQAGPEAEFGRGSQLCRCRYTGQNRERQVLVRKGSRVGGKTESNKVRRKKSLTEKKKCMPLAGERTFSHVVRGLTETWVLLLWYLVCTHRFFMCLSANSG